MRPALPMKMQTAPQKPADRNSSPLAFTGPVNFGLTLRRYRAYGDDAANQFDGTTFRKVCRFGESLHLLVLTESNGGLQRSIFPTTRKDGTQRAADRMARKILGLDFDLLGFYTMAESDPILRGLVSRFFGMRPTLGDDLFEMLVTSITAQQINLQFAFTVRSRLIRRYGEPFDFRGTRYFAFPTPEKLARARLQTLRKLQFTQRKAEYIVDLSRRICDGGLDLDSLRDLSEEQIHERLTASRGIGRWTVDWLLARGLGRPSAFPAGDLGVAKAVRHFYFNDSPQPENTLRDFSKRWDGFQNLAVHYLLAGYYFDPDSA